MADFSSSYTPVASTPDGAGLARRADMLSLLSPHLAQRIWMGSAVGSVASHVVSTGFVTLDAALPGRGWACQGVTEILQSQAGVAEWRLLTPALARVASAASPVMLVGCPHEPYSPGLHQSSLHPRHLIWVQAEAMAQRLWVAEQAIQSVGPAAVLVWLPHARPEQIRRLQTHALGSEALVFLMRPDVVRHEASAAPLRLALSVAGPWDLAVQVLKRRGGALDGTLTLRSLPGRLSTVRLARRVPAFQEQSDGIPASLAGAVARREPSWVTE
jgi:protein ImuA